MKTMKIISFLLFYLFSFNCYSQNCSNTSTGRPPINDLGTGFWRGYQGGLYPNGFNIRPSLHNNGGLQMASQIVPLDTAGNYNPNGKIVWLSVGMSNTTMETQVFKPMADTFQNKNTKLVLVDGAQGGQDINAIINPNANFWNVIVTRLQSQGLSVKQVQAIWFKEAEAGPTDTSFPGYSVSYKNKMKTVMQILRTKYPNVKVCYISSRIYAGYATTGLNPEPYAYYTGWSVKWMIEDQINGDTSLTYTGSNPKSPWLSWGPYPWADGTIPRIDGLTWICPTDYNADGTHPSMAGRQKVANMLFQFFTTDQTCVTWFLQNISGINNSGEIPTNFQMYQNYPNPFNPKTIINFQLPMFNYVSLKVYDILGKEIATLVNEELKPGTYEVDFDGSGFASGVYYYKLIAHQGGSSTGEYVETRKMVLIK